MTLLNQINQVVIASKFAQVVTLAEKKQQECFH
jgi:hypothetical protein